MKELVAREPGPLVIGSRFGVIDSLEEITSMEAPYDTESGTVAGRCQRA